MGGAVGRMSRTGEMGIQLLPISRSQEGDSDKMMPTILVWTLTLLSAGFFILCDSLSTNWAKTSSVSSVVTVVVLSPVAYLLFGLLASRVNLAIAGSLVNLMIMIGAVLVGLLYFKEHVTMLQWVGIGLGGVAIVILSVASAPK
jgi:drug/metabolite transporter (DMT)-like permease